METHGKRAVAGKEAKVKRKMAMETPEHVGHVARQDTLQRGVEKKVTQIYAIDEDDSENVEEATDDEEDL